MSSGHAVINTRHRTRSGPLGAAVGDGDQDADTALEPPPAEPATPSTAALRSVGEDLVAGVDQPVEQRFGDDGVREQWIPVNWSWHMFVEAVSCC